MHIGQRVARTLARMRSVLMFCSGSAQCALFFSSSSEVRRKDSHISRNRELSATGDSVIFVSIDNIGG